VRRNHIIVAAAVVGAFLSIRSCACSHEPLHIATFNIENFGSAEKDTDTDRLLELVSALDADVIAVQEIEDPAVLERLASRLGRYTVALSRCGGGSNMRVGFLFDAKRVRLESLQEYAELDPRGEGACTRGDRPGLLGRFAATDGRRFALLAVHLTALGDEEFASKRRSQWRRAIAIAKSTPVPTAILGDTNSTGWLDDRHGERSFIEDELAAADMKLLTEKLPCSEYFTRQDRLTPSMLDHVAVTSGFPAARATLHGYCRELSCREIPVRDAPPDFARVSDHCPVSVQ
jgi:endonuclease/exonuclease/phosphatase family metal-dependent hydrolase